ncbi:ferritin-like domain-containing protein [Polyangium sp. 15x6]|uniref:ferritin-like domain-containing protein n=1 Tax=Polyangium sp. 15x6 TaxID=3042687 RepID=UPI00249BB0D3|nr:ferritin-like domain-containing protein [Polyangium sp. 15x6]MDI3282834.1 ferritin-like domain-containing protein [Polyangium sp. 15x6]
MTTPPSTHDEPIDFTQLDPSALPAELVAHARLVWADRVRTEYRSIQIAARFLTEALAAGEPLDVVRRISETIDEERRHTELSRRMCEALGGPVPSPRDVAAPLEDLHAVPIEERVLATAISLFLVNETFSVGYIEDLLSRAEHPVTRAVLASIAGDEAEHEAFGPELVSRWLRDLPAGKRAAWRGFTSRLVRAHLDRAEQVLARTPPEKHDLVHWPEPDRAHLGLHGEVRLALLCKRTYEEKLAPTLAKLGLG